jgi:hypothetical protein
MDVPSVEGSLECAMVARSATGGKAMGFLLLLAMLAGWLARQQHRGITEGQENTRGAQPRAAADGSA